MVNRFNQNYSSLSSFVKHYNIVVRFLFEASLPILIMSITVQFDLPINISESLHTQAEEEAKIAYIMTLLKYGEISSGIAGKLLGISRLEMIELMEEYSIPIFPDQSREELEQEVEETLKLLEIDSV
jgi:predicted HTH domain antitoxin